MKMRIVLLAAVLFSVGSMLHAQEPVVGVKDPESLFKDSDSKLNRNKQAALHIMRELLQCGQWDRAGEWLTDAYHQHNPNAASGLKGVVTYFTQVACLFPHAASAVISYRAEEWSCVDRGWHEIDTRPFFLINADNKENSYERALFFFRENRIVMQSLEEYVMRRRGGAIGGVRFSSVRLPIPTPGIEMPAYERRPLETYAVEDRKEWYWTPANKRDQACQP
jgi:hypothetical protein